MNFHLKECMD